MDWVSFSCPMHVALNDCAINKSSQLSAHDKYIVNVSYTLRCICAVFINNEKYLFSFIRQCDSGHHYGYHHKRCYWYGWQQFWLLLGLSSNLNFLFSYWHEFQKRLCTVTGIIAEDLVQIMGRVPDVNIYNQLLRHKRVTRTIAGIGVLVV